MPAFHIFPQVQLETLPEVSLFHKCAFDVKYFNVLGEINFSRHTKFLLSLGNFVLLKTITSNFKQGEFKHSNIQSVKQSNWEKNNCRHK